MSRKINAQGAESSKDFKLPPANKYSGSNKNIKVKRQSTKGDRSALGSKSSDRVGAPFIRGDTIGGKKNMNENISGDTLTPIPKQLSSSNLDDDLNTSGLTEKQELVLLK